MPATVQMNFKDFVLTKMATSEKKEYRLAG